jgi:hypothetical protein
MRTPSRLATLAASLSATLLPSLAHAQPFPPLPAPAAQAAPAGAAAPPAAGALTPSTANAQTAPASGQTSPAGAGDAPGIAVPTPPAQPEPLGPLPPPYDTTGTAGARAVGMAPPGANHGNFVDTRLSWTFGDDDVLHKTGELIPLSPTFSMGDRQQYRLFFDSLNSRFSGRENLTHLVMYKRMPGFIEHLTTEAALVLRFDMAALSSNTGNLNAALYDAGSYIRIFYNTNANRETDGLSAVFFPLDTDRFRLGYLYDISWGGTNASINQSIFPRIQGSSPGMKLEYDAEKWYAFAGFKTATIVQPQQVLSPGNENDVEFTRVGETNYGGLAGFGVDPLPFMRLDAGAGIFQQGKFDLDDVRGQSVCTRGGSARLVFHKNMPVPQSVDFLLYRNDPMKPMILFSPEKYDPGELAYSVSVEGSYLSQRLKNFDAAGVTKNQGAMALAVQGVVTAGYARFSATGIYRDLNFVVRNVPGFIPFETLPSEARTDPELFGAIAADYHIAKLKLTSGIAGGVQLPATFGSDFRTGGLPASRTIVVRQQGDESILPYNKDRAPIFQARISVRWQLSDILGAVVWGQYVRDNNATRIDRSTTEGTASLRQFQDPDRLGVGASLQARF